MRNVYEFWHSKLIEYINLVLVIWNSKLEPNFRILADLVPRFKFNCIFMKFGIQSRENTQILNILFGIDDLDTIFGPAIEVL